MTPLETELLRLLEAERAFPPMMPQSLARVLHAIGYTPEPTLAEIVAALEALKTAGKVEIVRSARLGPRYRVMRTTAAAPLLTP